MSVLERLLSSEVRLPSPPAIAVRILDLVRKDESSARELARVIQADPALASKMLRLVNSAFYARPRKISSVDTAVAVVGSNAAKNIALSFVLAQSFSTRRGERFDPDLFWRRSITSAVAAELISGAVRSPSEDAFITALLQDIGIAAMFTCRPADYLKVLDEKMVTGLPVVTVEREIFGFDHQEVGADLLQNWGLPESIYQPIRYHHDVEQAPAAMTQFCNVIRVSDRIAATYYGSSMARNIRSAMETLSTVFGLDNDRINILVDSVAAGSIEVLAQFEMDPINIKPFSEILQQANEELSRLNLSYEMLMMEYRQAKVRAELLAAELKKANHKLNDLAFRDGLTGLYNHRYFQEALERELAAASRYRRALSLIMLDIDHFKTINDASGHQQGDTVLQTVASEIVVRMRKSDLVARYGGDEIAIILPDTGLAAAMTLGEQCQAAVGQAVKTRLDMAVTLSLGVAAFTPAYPVTKDQLIRSADEALYQSKQRGRNCVTPQRLVSQLG
jgi:diguanylate cyclase (GGDEF)-like protein